MLRSRFVIEFSLFLKRTDSCKNVPEHDYEHSEVLLYYVRLLEESNELSDALAFLEDNSKTATIVDKVAVLEIRGELLAHAHDRISCFMIARLLSKLGTDHREQCEATWCSLLEKNPDNRLYYAGLFLSKGLDLGTVIAAQRSRLLSSR